MSAPRVFLRWTALGAAMLFFGAIAAMLTKTVYLAVTDTPIDEVSIWKLAVEFGLACALWGVVLGLVVLAVRAARSN